RRNNQPVGQARGRITEEQERPSCSCPADLKRLFSFYEYASLSEISRATMLKLGQYSVDEDSHGIELCDLFSNLIKYYRHMKSRIAAETERERRELLQQQRLQQQSSSSSSDLPSAAIPNIEGPSLAGDSHNRLVQPVPIPAAGTPAAPAATTPRARRAARAASAAHRVPSASAEHGILAAPSVHGVSSAHAAPAALAPEAIPLHNHSIAEPPVPVHAMPPFPQAPEYNHSVPLFYPQATVPHASGAVKQEPLDDYPEHAYHNPGTDQMATMGPGTQQDHNEAAMLGLIRRVMLPFPVQDDRAMRRERSPEMNELDLHFRRRMSRSVSPYHERHRSPQAGSSRYLERGREERRRSRTRSRSPHRSRSRSPDVRHRRRFFGQKRKGRRSPRRSYSRSPIRSPIENEEKYDRTADSRGRAHHADRCAFCDSADHDAVQCDEYITFEERKMRIKHLHLCHYCLDVFDPMHCTAPAHKKTPCPHCHKHTSHPVLCKKLIANMDKRRRNK
ncbi:hypothetical protein PFISCL1PPCAC_26349, partial [Pristionchus fissidentatus]